MKVFLSSVLFLSLSLSIQAQSNWMKNATIWKSYEQRAMQLIEKDQLTQKESILLTAQEPRLLNYHALANNVTNIQEQVANLSKMTLFVVYWNQDTMQEQLLWSISNQEKDYLLSTTERLANLTHYQFINYLSQSKSSPQIQTYFQYEKEMPLAALKFGEQPMNTNIPVQKFRGTIAEIILFQHVLSPSKRQQIQTYLSLKYGIPLSENYVSTGGDLLKKVENEAFIHRIAGLGRNDDLGLYQKQASSSITECSLAIGLGQIEEENHLNRNELQNNTYLIWSDNDQSLALQQRQILEIPSLERLWEMSVSGNISMANTELQIDVSNLNIEEDQNLYLVIYEDENKQQKHYHQASVISKKGVATFKNINWDSDQSGSDFFSFAIGKDLIPNVKIQFPKCATNENGRLELAAIGGQAPYQFELKNEEGKKIGKWKLEDEKETQLVELPTGDYQLIISDQKGTRYEENFFFQAADAPVISLEQQYFLAENTALNLNAQLNNFSATYQWKNSIGETLSNQASLEVEKAGIYHLTMEEDGCISKQQIEVIPLNEARNILALDLSPNPSTDGRFNINAQFDQAAASRLNIYNLKGQLLKTIAFDTNHSIDYKDDLLENGIYLIELKTRKTKMTKKLIVQKTP
ncbi:MAG: T9SS type A sorting domain-containing protein [Bacteroidota bacterium]